MIDILQQIEDMRLKRSWSENELCRRAGISQSTVNTWYRKNQIPTVQSLEKICCAFDTSLSVLLADNGHPVKLSSEEYEFLTLLNKLTPSQRDNLLNFLQSMLLEY